MTSLVESVTLVGEASSVLSGNSEGNIYKHRQRRHILKSKENTYKHKCNKVLKRKLKKYKLRQDGAEDQDVLNVSEILLSSLIINSPNSLKNVTDIEDFRPKNYLFKMGRKKTVNKITESAKEPAADVLNQGNEVTYNNPANISQEKKETNAFKLLMDSRNKSIGGNSPGKDKSINESPDEELQEKKNVKAKRQLILQKMAESKGSLKKKELEEYHEEYIKRKMEKRTEKLKSMILNDKKVIQKQNGDVNLNTNGSQNTIASFKKGEEDKMVSDNKVRKKVKTLQIVDIFNSIDSIEESVMSPERKQISKEDSEFLKKLSPSLKKKESMLSYFAKLEKDNFQAKCSVDSENYDIIKVKLGPKKKGKKKKLSLNRNVQDNMAKNNDENSDKNRLTNIGTLVAVPISHEVLVVNSTSTAERHKRKRNLKTDINFDIQADLIASSDSRLKRSVKRPVKYIDDAGLSSSDEELHIFTPKKKKHIENENNIPKAINNILEPTTSNEKKIVKDKFTEPVKSKTDKKGMKIKTQKSFEPKKPVKLAPIFKKQSQVDPGALEAKQKFLHSGVPDKLKKIVPQQNSSILDPSFPVVVHVQQIYEPNTILNQVEINIPENYIIEDTFVLNNEEYVFKKIINLHEIRNASTDFNFKKSISALLHSMKQLYPKFPVYRTYRYLRAKSKGEYKDFNYIDLDNSIEIMNGVIDIANDSPDKLNWTDKFKALSTNQLIGNFDSIKELRKWLITWTENHMKSKSKSTSGSDSSDFYVSDTDSRDSVKTMNNLLIVTGPTGSGKTSSVYAVAAELAMKVIEVNVSSKRTGKIMLQDLQEATQSHKVNRGAAMDSSQKYQEKALDVTIKPKKRGRPKKLTENAAKKKSSNCDLSATPSSQESVRTHTSLILIDDADIVFEQDDGFSSAIVQLVQSSKRPVILVTSSLVCPHLQRFFQTGKILRMYPLLPKMLGTWLDVMCLADGSACWPGLGAKFLNYFKGDIRKTINYLQFHSSAYISSSSDEETASQNVDNFKTNIDDENSSMSWADHESSEGMKCFGNNYNIEMESNLVWNEFLSQQSNLLVIKNPIELFNIWWSIPHLLGTKPSSNLNIIEGNEVDTTKNKRGNITKLQAMADALDAISLADYFTHMKSNTESNITSDPWFCTESDSVSEQENLDHYFRASEIANEISHTLVTGSIQTAQNVLNCEKKTNLHFPVMELQRQRDKIISRHNKLTSYLNPSAMLDRRVLSLDYWSSCRTICRVEKSKTDSNAKRNNRFCHYLKSLSILCKSDTFDNLCDSLCSSSSEPSVTNFDE